MSTRTIYRLGWRWGKEKEEEEEEKSDVSSYWASVSIGSKYVCVNLCTNQGGLAIVDFFKGIRQRSSQGIASI